MALVSGFVLSRGSDQIMLVLTWLLQGCVPEWILHFIWYLCNKLQHVVVGTGLSIAAQAGGVCWLLGAVGASASSLASGRKHCFGGNLLLSESAEGCQDLSALGIRAGCALGK